MKKIIALGLVTILLLTAAGCSENEKDEKSNTKDKPQETLVIYTGRSLDLIEPIVKDFTKETNIKVELRDGDSGELASQIITEGKNSKADLFFSQDAGALGLLSERGLLQKLPTDLTKDVSPKFKSPKNEWVGTSGRARVIVYNNELAGDDIPTSIEDLVSEKYKGKVAYAPTNASFHSFVTALRVTLGEEKAEDWLKKFSENEPKAYEKNGAIVKAVNDGEIAFGLVNHYYIYELGAEIGTENLKAENIFLKDGSAGSLINAAGLGVLKTSKNQSNAEKFVKYLLSDKGQEYFVNDSNIQ